MSLPGWVKPLVAAVGALLAFAAHFRPWEVAFLEEWALAHLWMGQGGWAWIANFFEWSLSRPLHLVPTAMGLALADGAPWGIFLILGLVAAGQFLAVVWALRGLSRSFWINAAVALFISLHPLWPGGFLQRFLPAQTAALGLIIAMGMLIRWLRQGRVRWVVWACVVLAAGLAVYPGPAAAAPLMAVAVALAVDATWRRRIIAVASITASVALVTVYSLVIARLISPSGVSYESGNYAPAMGGGPREIVTLIVTALLERGLMIIAGVLAIAVLGAVLALTGAIPHWAGWLMAGTAVISPLCAVVFYGNVGWLEDVERIAYATSLGLAGAMFVWPLTSLGRRIRFEAILAALLALFSILGAVRGIQHWQPYIALQHKLFEEVAPAMREAERDEMVVVVDHTGSFGSEWTLPQFYVSAASQIMNDDPTPVWLCSLPEDPPLLGAGVCETKDTGDDLRLVNSFEIAAGRIDVYIGTPPSADSQEG